LILKKILVVGGGTVALRKIEKLMPFSPDITVAAPKICDEIKALDVKKLDREFCDSDLDGAFCVISATDDEQLLSLCLTGIEPNKKTVESLIEEYEK